MIGLRVLVAALCLSAVACAEAPPAGACRVDSDAALSAIVEIYTGRAPAPGSLPDVFTVPADCVGPTGLAGFMRDGGCRGGSTLDSGLYIVADGYNRFSRHLPHEAMHWVGVDHDGLPTYPDDSEAAAKITMATVYLWAHPSIDQIADGPRGGTR